MVSAFHYNLVFDPDYLASLERGNREARMGAANIGNDNIFRRNRPVTVIFR
ncbi:MAG: hypothetical protein Pars92KO_20350 [Parasphingorhabdus sp.]